MRSAADTPAPFELEAEDEHVEALTDEKDRAFGRYRLSFQIASGGMATVYLGRAVGPAGFDRPVAIKRIHPHLAKRKHFVEMFLDEARLVSRINHPNVCTMHDFGEVDGTYYMAMEYLVGVPLARLIKVVSEDEDRMASSRWHGLAARIAADAAEGLHAAHELKDPTGKPLGVVHRDVSPQNVFVTFDGAVKVVDFGIALARGRLHQTSTGTLKGKFGYMAPEHASGNEIDRRADVWALGVCLWEMLTGRRLFRRKNEMDTLLAIRSERILAPSSIVSTVPPALEAIVMKALSRDVDERYPTARALGRALLDFLRQHSEPAGLADLAEFIEPLLRAQRTQKLELVETVFHDGVRIAEVHVLPTQVTPNGARFGAATASIADPGASPDQEHSGITTRGKVPDGWNDPDTVATPTPLPPEPLPLPPPGATGTDLTPLPEISSLRATPPVMSPRLIAAGLVALLAIGSIAAIVIAVSSGEDEPSLAAAPIATPEAQEPPPPAVVEPTGAPPTAEPDMVFAPEPALAPAASERSPDVAREPAPPPDRDERAAREARTARTRETRASRTGRSTRAPATPPAPEEYGQVNIVTRGGWADVYLGARQMGRTPTTFRLRTGSYVLTLRPFGQGPPRRHPVTVQKDRITPVTITLP